MSPIVTATDMVLFGRVEVTEYIAQLRRTAAAAERNNNRSRMRNCSYLAGQLEAFFALALCDEEIARVTEALLEGAAA